MAFVESSAGKNDIPEGSEHLMAIAVAWRDVEKKQAVSNEEATRKTEKKKYLGRQIPNYLRLFSKGHLSNTIKVKTADEKRRITRRHGIRPLVPRANRSGKFVHLFFLAPLPFSLRMEKNIAANLLLLQNRVKRDPQDYKEEFLEQVPFFSLLLSAVLYRSCRLILHLSILDFQKIWIRL